MGTIQLATHEVCTGCGACAYRCPKHCIHMREDDKGIVVPVIDDTTCIECHSCEKACPILNPVPSHKPTMAYAAWSNNEEERRTSASGGIAAEMYKHALDNGYKVVGASQDKNFSVAHKLTTKEEDIELFKNSKYVFSDAHAAFDPIKQTLSKGCKVLFIGLPCQVAALRKLFKDNESLLLVELICHGTTPYSYLKQHIDMLSRQAGKTAKRMSFRDPHTYTYTYTFTLYDEDGQRFYAKRTKDGDTYQFGYHRAISYRENCYHCRFAKPERIADITIADYHGLGLSSPCSYDAKNVSLILVNTTKGIQWIEALIASKRIHADQRPLEEPVKGEAQLRHPSLKSKYRLMFEKEISAWNGDFEKAIQKPMQSYRHDERLKTTYRLPIKVLKHIAKAIIGNKKK